jgi:hypothetical protein
MHKNFSKLNAIMIHKQTFMAWQKEKQLRKGMRAVSGTELRKKKAGN